MSHKITVDSSVDVNNILLSKQIAYLDMSDGQRLYSLRDWVYFLSTSTNKNRSAPWSDLKKAIRKKGIRDLLSQIQTLEFQTTGGRQLSDFANEATLMAIKRYIEQTSQNKLKNEVIDFHPQVIHFFQRNGWQCQHHVDLPSGKTIDVVAHKEHETLVVECKPSLAGAKLYLAVGQVLCYTAEYKRNACPALATFSSQVSEYVLEMCSCQGITVIHIPNVT